LAVFVGRCLVIMLFEFCSRELVATACGTVGLSGARNGGGRVGAVAHKLDMQMKARKLICCVEEVPFRVMTVPLTLLARYCRVCIRAGTDGGLL
jgi:hypothetical protein